MSFDGCDGSWCDLISNGSMCKNLLDVLFHMNHIRPVLVRVVTSNRPIANDGAPVRRDEGIAERHWQREVIPGRSQTICGPKISEFC